MVQRGRPVMSNDAISFLGEPSICAAILEPVLLQQVLGRSADKRLNEKPFGNRQMRSNMGEEFSVWEYTGHKW